MKQVIPRPRTQTKCCYPEHVEPRDLIVFETRQTRELFIPAFVTGGYVLVALSHGRANDEPCSLKLLCERALANGCKCYLFDSTKEFAEWLLHH